MSPRASLLSRRVLLLAGAFALAAAAGCDRVKNAMTLNQADPRWQGDSALLASDPEILFQVWKTDKGPRVVPMAMLGSRGFRTLGFGDRGWRAFDLYYMQKGHELAVLQHGRTAGTVAVTRGMWDPPTDPLDTLRCPVQYPVAIAPVPAGVRLLTSKPRPALKPVAALSGGELQEVLGTIPTLVAPTLGVSGAMLARYKREVYQVNSGASGRPSVVVVYDDPEQVADSVAPIAQRPRQLIVILDRGVYGYRRSYTYTTVGNRQSLPRLGFADYVDIDGDGTAELFFDVRDERYPLATFILRFEGDVWREMLRHQIQRCGF